MRPFFCVRIFANCVAPLHLRIFRYKVGKPAGERCSPLHFGAMVCYAAKSLRSLRGLLYLFSYAHSSFLTPHSSFERRFPLHIVSLPLQLPFLPLYFAVLCNFTIIFGCFNVKNQLSRSIPLQTLFSLSKQ